jgi:ribosomal protein S18 acetylase RimI-like enzyme
MIHTCDRKPEEKFFVGVPALMIFTTMTLSVLSANLSNTEHAAAVLSLLDHYASSPAGGNQPLADYARQHLIASLQQRENVVVVLAYAATTPVGLLIGFEGFSTFQCKPLLNVHDVVVHENYRGQGVAGKLFARAETIARERGYCKLTLEVLSKNISAQAAYRKVGFAAYELDPALGQALFWEKKL